MDTSVSGRNIGILGGTFDPPHIGHLIVASEALWRLSLEEVRLVPARRPPHKPGGAQGTARQRLTWARALAADQPGVTVADDELRRDGPSYTADTVTAMARAEPAARLWFLMGSDQLAALPQWHEPERILATARLGVVPRGGHTAADVRALAARIAPDRVDVVDAPRIDISSSLVRERIAAGRPIRHLVPAGVLGCLVSDGLVPSATV